MNPIRYFGYWSGQLPPVTELHFRSFVQHHPDAHYDLWLDTDAHSDAGWPRGARLCGLCDWARYSVGTYSVGTRDAPKCSRARSQAPHRLRFC